MLKEAASLLECEIKQIPGRAEELFGLWKDIVKKKKDTKFELRSREEFDGDVLQKTAEILRTQKEHITKTIKRFLDEIKDKL